MTPAQWAQMAKELDGPDVDGVFLSGTNTTQIEAIADIERQTRQAGGQQQSGRAVGLRETAEEHAAAAQADAGTGPADGAFGLRGGWSQVEIA